MSTAPATAPAIECPVCHRPAQGGSLFCQYDGTFLLDQEGTVVMATRLSRVGSAIVNAILVFLTLFIGWVIWWFIVAPKGQNPGKALLGLRVIKTNGSAMNTGSMFVRGLLGILCGLIPLYLDDLWILWDKDAQTLHDKLADTVVVKAQGSEKIVERGSLGPLPAGYARPTYAPPVTFPPSSSPAPTAPTSTIPADNAEALRQLEDMRSKNLITDAEYQEKRKAILDRI
ncbi:MAG: RDD family protein [Chloroflexota bacterium]